jgi:hypothetical protein
MRRTGSNCDQEFGSEGLLLSQKTGGTCALNALPGLFPGLFAAIAEARKQKPGSAELGFLEGHAVP